MTIFELIKTVLDDIYVEAQAQYGGNVDVEIKQRMQYLVSAYGNLDSTSFSPVNYKDPATRFAYVYKYVPAHADYIVQILKILRSERDEPIFPMDDLRISCVGGGPGSDLIGVLKYLDSRGDREPVKSVMAYLLDKEQAWADTWTELNVPLDLNLKFNSAFQPLDVTTPGSWKSQKKFLQADLFTLSYFVSEIKSLDKNGELDEFWTTLFDGAKPGAYFLYNDNGHTSFTSYFDSKWKGSGLTCLLAADTRMTPSSSEQASELNYYRQKFGHMSKLQAQITYRVLRKN